MAPSKNNIPYPYVPSATRRFGGIFFRLVNWEPVRGVLPRRIRALALATKVTLAAIDFARNHLRAGMTERDLQNLIAQYVKKRGFVVPGTSLLVSSGPRTAQIHGYASKHLIEFNSAILIDCGIMKRLGRDWSSDVTRSWWFGVPPPEYEKVYALVQKANEVGIEMCRPGVECWKVDQAVRRVINEAGYEIPHGIGHGLGRYEHNVPFLNPTSHDVLKAGQVVTMEPGIYIKGKFGVRIEDMVLITRDKPAVLSRLTYK